MTAQDLGKRLLAEVEEVNLDEILNLVVSQNNNDDIQHFGLPWLDSTLTSLARHRTWLPTKPPPIIELTSLQPAGGKTHLLYHLTALAILPTHLGGKNSCAVILDTDNRFSILRLVQQLQLIAARPHPSIPSPPPPLPDDALVASLAHLHIFHPLSLSSTLSTLSSLPSYLFNPNRHSSSNRSLSFIALDSVSAFHWEARAKTETPRTTDLPGSDPEQEQAQPRGSCDDLASALKSTSRTLRAAVVLTAWNLAPRFDDGDGREGEGGRERGLRSSLLSMRLRGMVDLRLVVRRERRRKREVMMEGVGEGRMERGEGAVKGSEEKDERDGGKGFFLCEVNEWGVGDEGFLREARGRGGMKFWIGEEGVVLEEMQ